MQPSSGRINDTGERSRSWLSKPAAGGRHGARVPNSGRNPGGPRAADRTIRRISRIARAAGLESAVATPQATFGGEFLHASIPAMAAAYLFHLCQNHAFIDGNKRVGANAAVTENVDASESITVSMDDPAAARMFHAPPSKPIKLAPGAHIHLIVSDKIAGDFGTTLKTDPPGKDPHDHTDFHFRG